MAELVLIVDPNEVERRHLQQLFNQAGFAVVEASSPIEGLFQTLEQDPDLILLAEEVPPLEAGDLIIILRRLTEAPVMIVGSGGEPEEVDILELGADFYLHRPLSSASLIARARALLRRYRGSQRNVSIPVILGRVSLTPTQQRLLACLAAHRGRPVALLDLMTEGYGGQATRATVKVALWRVGRRLREVGVEVISERGRGYRLAAGTAWAPEQAAG